MVVDIFRSPLPSNNLLKSDNGIISKGSKSARRDGNEPPRDALRLFI